MTAIANSVREQNRNIATMSIMSTAMTRRFTRISDFTHEQQEVMKNIIAVVHHFKDGIGETDIFFELFGKDRYKDFQIDLLEINIASHWLTKHGYLSGVFGHRYCTLKGLEAI